jgi:hypothetical protein
MQHGSSPNPLRSHWQHRLIIGGASLLLCIAIGIVILVRFGPLTSTFGLDLDAHK